MTTLSEDQIERTVEISTDDLDRRFMNGALTQAQYDAACKQINDWAEHQYEARRRAIAKGGATA